MEVKSLLILVSYHHHNTERIANVFARVLEAEIRTPQQIDPAELQEYDLVGFGSGIYGAKHHKALLNLVDRLPQVTNKKAFIFSPCGVPAIGMTEQVVVENHSTLRGRLQSKGYAIVDEFGCVGLNTNSFLKLFGGINQGRPSAEDLGEAEAFARNLERTVGSV